MASTDTVNTDTGMVIIKGMMQNRKRIAAVLAAMMCFGQIGCGKQQEAVQGQEVLQETVQTTESAEGTVVQEDTFEAKVTYQGKTYKYNSHLSNYIFMGVDSDGIVETSDGSLDAGQTDALLLLSVDRMTGDVTLISIPRDTITTYNIYGRDGTDLGPTVQQLSLAYAYGDGRYSSCKMTKEAVSRLFYRIPIKGYLSATLEAMEQMSSLIGGVNVVVPNDSLADRNPNMKAGETVEINEDNIVFYLRTRDISVTNSALYRLERQNAYLEAAIAKIMQEFSSNPGIVTRVFTGLEPYMITNIGNDEFVDIMEGLAEGGTLTRWTVPGEGVAGERYDEFHVDEDAFYEQVILSFFEEEP